MDYIKQDGVYFIFCEPRLQKAENEEALEKFQDTNTFLLYEKLFGTSFQLFALPGHIANRIKAESQIGKIMIVPYQAALRKALRETSEATIFLHSVSDAILMTAIKEKEVSHVIEVVHNLKESVQGAINDYKTIFRTDGFKIATNSREVANFLPEFDVRVIPVALNGKGLPEFILPEQIHYRRKEKEKRNVRIIACSLGILILLAAVTAYRGYTDLKILQHDKNILQRQVADRKTAFLKYRQENIENLFTSEQKNKTLSIISRTAKLPDGYSLSNLSIIRSENGYEAIATINVLAIGMDPDPLKNLFPDGTVEPCFSKEGQAYKVTLHF